MIYASSIGCCAIEWGERRKTAREGRSVYMYLIYRLSEVEKTLKKRRQNGHEVPLIWVGKGEEGREREREMISIGKASRALYPYNELPPTSRTAPATPYSPSFTYRRSCVNVFDDLNLLKSLNRKKTDCRQTVSDCQTLRRSTTSGIEEVLCHKRRH